MNTIGESIARKSMRGVDQHASVFRVRAAHYFVEQVARGTIAQAWLAKLDEAQAAFEGCVQSGEKFHQAELPRVADGVRLRQR
jgi:hypothetical protein